MTKEGNRNKFSTKVLTDIITGNFGGEMPKRGRRLNPGLEVVFGALIEDAMAFDKGKEHYKEISQLIASLDEKWGNRYAEETLRIKKRNPFVENETLTLTKAYFDAKGERFLPASLPTDPRGHVKHILQNLDVIPMPEPEPKGIDGSLFKRMKPREKSSR